MGGSSSAGSPSSSSALAGRELNYLGNGNGHGSGNGKALFADVSLGADAGGEEQEDGDDDQFEEEDLNDEHDEGEGGEEEERAIGDPGTPTRSNGRRSTKSNGHRRAASEASSVGGGEGKYGFLRQRVEQQYVVVVVFIPALHSDAGPAVDSSR